MFAFIFTTLIIHQSFTYAHTNPNIVINRQVCHRNTTTCLNEYQKKLLIPLDIGDLSFAVMIYYIRRYNYEMNYISHMYGKPKRARRKNLNMFYNKNYKLFSYSTELEYLNNLCDIQYNKIDNKIVQKIRFKIVKIKQLIETKYYNYRFYNSLILMNLGLMLGIMLVVIFLG